MNSKELYINTKPVKLFFIAAIPGAVSMIASALYMIFDGAFVGQILGDSAFAAVNLAIPFVIINFSLADLIGVGSSVPIAIYLGQKREREANNVFTMACLMIVVTGTIIGGAIYIAAPWMIAAMGAKGELASLAVQYIRVYAICSPVTTIVFAMDNFLRISGKIKMSMWLNVAMSGITVTLEYIFLALLGFDVWGAALATCISMAGIAAVAIYPFVRRKLQLKFVKPHFTVYESLRIVKCGMPMFLSNISGRITSIAMNVALLHFGGEAAVSVFGIMMYLGDILQSMQYGVCDSLQPAIGYNWGAGRYDRVRKIVRCCYTASAVISIVSALVLCVFPTELASIFTNNTDSAFMANVVTALRYFGISRLLQWFCFATQSYMSAVEKPVFSGIISVSISFVFPMLALIVLYPMGLTGIWLNVPITMVLAAGLSVILLARFKRGIEKSTE